MTRPHMLTFQDFRDPRGNLQVIDNLPFPPARTFVIDDIPRDSVRGQHAHRKCTQIIGCTAGAFAVKTIGPDQQEDVWPLSRGQAVLVPPMNWIELYDFNARAVCLVLASHPYDAAEMITDKAEVFA